VLLTPRGKKKEDGKKGGVVLWGWLGGGGPGGVGVWFFGPPVGPTEGGPPSLPVSLEGKWGKGKKKGPEEKKKKAATNPQCLGVTLEFRGENEKEESTAALFTGLNT